jgi:ribonuclease HI
VDGYEIYSDGACSGNPGPGGWGVIVISPDGRKQELNGYEAHTTAVTVWSDSQYVVNGGRSWLDGWKRKGWKTAGRADVMNRDLWESVDAERSRLRLTWEWVRGHNGHVLNERADSLARKAILAGSAT